MRGIYSNGSSPRGRGTWLQSTRTPVWSRFIPAWAGNIPDSRARPLFFAVHPRVGGEHHVPHIAVENPVGSSPRGRGTLSQIQPTIRTSRFIPAWAGNIQTRPPRESDWAVHPRVGGEHFPSRRSRMWESGSSPRGRGTSPIIVLHQLAHRFIPAWAGNMNRRRRAIGSAAVHPRVGGEHGWARHGAVGHGGSSPRGRGTSRTGDHILPLARFIPAWAGNMFHAWR